MTSSTGSLPVPAGWGLVLTLVLLLFVLALAAIWMLARTRAERRREHLGLLHEVQALRAELQARGAATAPASPSDAAGGTTPALVPAADPVAAAAPPAPAATAPGRPATSGESPPAAAAAPPLPTSSGDATQELYTLSHDLRAPIRVVEGFTRILKEDYGRALDRVGNDHLDRVLGAAARMNLMIDALLAMSRLASQPLQRQPVNLSQLAAWVVEELRRAAPEREVEVHIEPGLVVEGDPTLLRGVLENLLGNAWKYSARVVRAQVRFERQGGPAGGTPSTFVVSDNGAGFDMRGAERLFGLFQRLHSQSEFPGHGVGLASVKRVVQRHGGRIWAEAEPGRGAAFYFTLG